MENNRVTQYVQFVYCNESRSNKTITLGPQEVSVIPYYRESVMTGVVSIHFFGGCWDHEMPRTRNKVNPYNYWGLTTLKSVICNRNWTEWSTIQGVIARVISKSDEREARGRFEITLSTITPWIVRHEVQLLINHTYNKFRN